MAYLNYSRMQLLFSFICGGYGDEQKVQSKMITEGRLFSSKLLLATIRISTKYNITVNK